MREGKCFARLKGMPKISRDGTSLFPLHPVTKKGKKEEKTGYPQICLTALVASARLGEKGKMAFGPLILFLDGKEEKGRGGGSVMLVLADRWV